jgi:hypothetical protein
MTITFLTVKKHLKTLDMNESNDPDWVRTSDLHPVKVALSLLSYRIMSSSIVARF